MSQSKYFLFSILLSIFLITSCSGMETTTNTSTVTAESTEISTTIPESTPTLISLPTKTKPTMTLLPPIKMQCAGDSQETHKLDLSDVVALNKPVKQGNFSEYGFFLLNLRNGNKIRDVYEGMFTQVSPDRKYVAYKYLPGDISFLSVIDGTGKTVSDFEFRFDEKRIVDYFNWQNSKQLRILHEGNGDKLSAQLLNPFTKEYAPLQTDWKEVYTPKNPFQDELPQWKFDLHATSASYAYGANILYDPSLTRVLYPNSDGFVTLVNVETEKELATTQFEDWGRLPSWSPDGQHLSIVSNEGNADEFYLIRKDGNEFERITNFSEQLGFGFIPEAAWSPDSSQIAFWLNTEAAELEAAKQSELAILDIDSRQVTRLCIQGISKSVFKPWLMDHPEPIWSPDGRYILITQWDDSSSPKNFYVVAIDPQTGIRTKISENTAPIGWMNEK